jgi:hypothetical protein
MKAFMIRLIPPVLVSTLLLVPTAFYLDPTQDEQQVLAAARDSDRHVPASGPVHFMAYRFFGADVCSRDWD